MIKISSKVIELADGYRDLIIVKYSNSNLIRLQWRPHKKFIFSPPTFN